MTSGEKYKTAIKDGRCVVHILADENTSFNSNFIGKFHNFWFEKERSSMGITFFKMNQS